MTQTYGSRDPKGAGPAAGCGGAAVVRRGDHLVAAEDLGRGTGVEGGGDRPGRAGPYGGQTGRRPGRRGDGLRTGGQGSGGPLRPHRRAGQQRRHHPRRRVPQDERRAVVRGDPRQYGQRVQHDAPGDQRHARPGLRPHRQHLLDQRAEGPDRPDQLFRRQGRDDRLHQGAGAGRRAQGRDRQLHRAGLYRHRNGRGDGPEGVGRHRGPDSRRPPGQGRGDRRHGLVAVGRACRICHRVHPVAQRRAVPGLCAGSGRVADPAAVRAFDGDLGPAPVLGAARRHHLSQRRRRSGAARHRRRRHHRLYDARAGRLAGVAGRAAGQPGPALAGAGADVQPDGAPQRPGVRGHGSAGPHQCGRPGVRGPVHRGPDRHHRRRGAHSPFAQRPPLPGAAAQHHRRRRAAVVGDLFRRRPARGGRSAPGHRRAAVLGPRHPGRDPAGLTWDQRPNLAICPFASIGRLLGRPGRLLFPLRLRGHRRPRPGSGADRRRRQRRQGLLRPAG
uniref:LigA n=1 Tax=Parastrongyloides trichosuri TaxID=131310 RepID=A0A0N5A0R6_PARTI